MPAKKFHKLDVDLPHQPLVNQRPWLVAGLLLASIILIAIAYAYCKR